MTGTWWKDEKELKTEQSALLDFDEDKNLLVQGPPGSGKTNLLLLRANQLFLGQFPNLHVVVFGSLLKQFIQMGGLQYKFPNDKIITHTRLFNDILLSEGQHFDSKGMDIAVARQERANRVEALLKAGKVGKVYEALLLDEAQDFSEQEIRLLRQLTTVLVGTADRKQAIYRVGGDPVKVLENCVDEIYPLKYHFRNGREICRVADAIYKGKPDYTPMLPSCQYDDALYPSKVYPKPGLTLSQQATAIAEQVEAQRFAYPDDLIAVLCPRNEDLNAIHDELRKTALDAQLTRANVTGQFDASRMVWLSTIAAAKGLEFRAVHIAGLDHLSATGQVAQKQLIYTGITRAKTALSLYWEKSIPGYLDAAVRQVAPPKAPATKKQIFGKA
ncbi:MAG TPA: ATP-binding domain-containing protein [Ottowia sp.]|nr:ATP-binding domain-containing protein [Ottowia sp.]